MKKKGMVLATAFIMMQLVVGVKMEVSADQYVQKVSNTTSVTYDYNTNDGKLNITNVAVKSSAKSVAIVMPEKFPTKGGMVEPYAIKKCAFSYNQGGNLVTSLKLPMSIKVVEEDAFTAMRNNLQTLYIPGSVSKVHPNSFSSTGGAECSIKNLYIRNSETSNTLINSKSKLLDYTNKIYMVQKKDAKGNYVNDNYITCTLQKQSARNGRIELLNALANSPAMNAIAKTEAKSILSKNMPSGYNISDERKIQIIHNYIQNHCIYSHIYSDGNDMTWISSSPIGSLVLGHGVCAGMSMGVQMLAEEAGVRTEYCADSLHAVNAFLPRDSKNAYIVDVANVIVNAGWNDVRNIDIMKGFCKNGKVTTTSGNTYNLGNSFYGNYVRVVVNNETDIPFDVVLCNTDNKAEKYMNYKACNTYDGKVFALGNKLNNVRRIAAAYGNVYHTLTLSQDGKNYLTFDCALSYGHDIDKTFKDKNGKTRTCLIKRNTTTCAPSGVEFEIFIK